MCLGYLTLFEVEFFSGEAGVRLGLAEVNNGGVVARLEFVPIQTRLGNLLSLSSLEEGSGGSPISPKIHKSNNQTFTEFHYDITSITRAICFYPLCSLAVGIASALSIAHYVSFALSL